MAASQSGANQHGIPNDPAARAKIRSGLSDAERAEFDAIVAKIDAG